MGTLDGTTNKVALRSFDIEVDIVISQIDSGTESVQYTICEIGKFSYDFGLTTDVDDITKIGIKAGSISVSFFDNDSATTYKSIYDAYFHTGTLYGTDPIGRATIKIYNPSGAGSANEIKCSFSDNDISYDINQRKTIINLQPLKPSDTDKTLSAVFSSPDFSNTDITKKALYRNTFLDPDLNGILVHDYIDFMLDTMYGTGGTTSINSNFFSPTGNRATDSGTDYLIIKNDSNSNPLDGGAEMTAPEIMANICGVEGSVFGNMLGVKTYFARNLVDTNNRIDMLESDFKSLKLETPNKKDYRELKVIHGSQTSSAASTTRGIDPSASKTANLSFRQGYMDRRTFQFLINNFQLGGSSTFSGNTVSPTGLLSYERLLLANHVPRISGTFFSCKKVLPHQTIRIQFAADAVGSTRLIHPLDGTYRFTKLTYDLFNDTVDFNAYRIA